MVKFLSLFSLPFFILGINTFTEEIVLQNGVGGYDGCTDTYLKSDEISPQGDSKSLFSHGWY